METRPERAGDLGVKRSEEHEHFPEAIRARLAAGPRQSYLRDWIYGGIDGAVTTFAIVSGAAGAQLSPAVVLILGFANLLADGFSMAASNYLGTKAERDEYHRLEAAERRHIKQFPEGEREEIRQIFSAKGFRGEDLERVVEVITGEPARWVRTMLTEEYGLPGMVRSPWRAALSTFSAFVVCGMAPLIPYLLGVKAAFGPAAGLTGAVFFAIGSAKSQWSITPWWQSGLFTLVVGAAAAGLAYGVGALLKQLL